MDRDANYSSMYPFGAHPPPPPPHLPLGANPQEMMLQGFAPFMPPINGWVPPQPAAPKPVNPPDRGLGGRRYSLFYEKPPPPMSSGRRYSLRTDVHNHIEEETGRGEEGVKDRSQSPPITRFAHSVRSGSSTVAIDNKIEQAMDLVKSHLMYAVREEVEVLKEQIKELMERLAKLEQENKVLRSEATQETLGKLPAPLPPIQNPLLQQLMAIHNPSASTSSS